MGLESILVPIIGIIVALFVQFLTRMTLRERKESTTEDRVKRLTNSLSEAVSLIGAIEAEIKSRSELAIQLEQDIKKYNQLKDISKSEVEAIAQLFRGELAKESRVSFWRGVGVNFLFFILGVGTSLLITKWFK
jgi:phosphate/sulfate permease